MAFQSSLSSILLMSSLLGDSFLVTKLFRLSVYFVCCLPLLLVPQIFPRNICFSIYMPKADPFVLACRFHKTVSVSDIYKMRDTIHIMEAGGGGRWVKLQPGIKRAPTPGQNAEGEVGFAIYL